jgi:hypothetical protein
MRIGSTVWRSYDNMNFMSGQTILECKDFAPFIGGCCKDCHSRSSAVHLNLERRTGLFVVRPPAPPGHELEWMADFSIHICAHVCCTIVCRVVQLPNSWWVEKAKELNTDEVWRLHTYGHRDGVAGYQDEVRLDKRRGTKPTARSRDIEDDELGGLDSWK